MSSLMSRRSSTVWQACLAGSLVCVWGCGSEPPTQNTATNPVVGGALAAPMAPTTPAAGVGAPSAVAGTTAAPIAMPGRSGTAGVGAAAAGTTAAAAAGTMGTKPSAGSGAAAGSGGGMAMAGTGAMAHGDDCVVGQTVDPSDATFMNNSDQWKASNGDIDLTVPKSVLKWMKDRVWEASHDAWHNVRRCRSGFAIPGAGGTTALCMTHKELIAMHQECSDAEDGYQFLVMHRHMMQALRQAFPSHADSFAGFPHFPFEAKEVPMEWQGRWGTGWAANIVSTAKTLEDVENKLSMFPTEGDLGKFIQCGGMASGASSIHGALHFKWVVNESPYSLGKQTVNIDNYMFWKLHGWIDQIWERYRVAKGLKPDEPKLVQALVDQCHEMHALGVAIDPKQATPTNMPLPMEKGYFHEMVRPILEKTCASCHSESSPEAGMALGGNISSANVVKGLVDVTAAHGGQFKRVVAKDPDHSWLYLKVSGMAASAGCMGAMCNAQVMPPTGQVTLTQAQLMTIRQWILDGAPAPTQ